MTDPKPAVVFYAPTFDAMGGGETWVNRIANALAARGWEVSVLGKAAPQFGVAHPWSDSVRRRHLAPATTPSAPSARSARLGRARAVFDVATNGWRPPGRFHRDVSAETRAELVRELRESAARPGGAVVVCSDVYTASHLAWAHRRKLTDLPFAIIHHNSFRSLSRGTRNAYLAASRAAFAIVALTPEDAQEFEAAGFAGVRSISNPSPATPERDHAAKARTLVSVGRMTSVKAVDVAIDAWQRVAPDFPDWRLELYGDGPERTALQQRVERARLQSSVTFMGVTENSSAVFASGAVNLLTSTFEGWPLVIGEAGVHRTPTIATDSSPGVRAQIDPGRNGELVPVGDAPAVAAAMARLLGDAGYRERLGRAAEEKQRQFGIERIAAEWEALITAMADDARRPKRSS